MRLGVGYGNTSVIDRLTQLSQRSRRGDQDQVVMTAGSHDFSSPGADRPDEVVLTARLRGRVFNRVRSGATKARGFGPMKLSVAKRLRHLDQRTATKALFEQARMPTVSDDNQARSPKVHGRFLSRSGMNAELGRFSRAPL
ncbi:MAG: hypothetical protein V4707_07465 [Pseudomonadota bacterium]